VTRRFTSERELDVAQVVGTFGGGGAQRVAYNLIRALDAAGVRSRGIAVRDVGDYAASAESPEMAALRAHEGGLVGRFKAMLRLRRLIRRWNLNTLHVHGSNSLPLVMAAIQGMADRPNVFFTWHDSQSVLEGGSAASRKALVWALRRCDGVYGSSASVAARLRSGAGLPRAEVFHGGAPVRAEARPDPAAPPLIVWMGRLVPQKDPAALIRVAARLKASGHRFEAAMIGSAHKGSAYGEEMRRLASSLRVEDVVRLPGFLDDREVNALLDRASIGVQTSCTEGFSMAVVEQMMAGLAVVATDVGDTGDVVDEETGILIPPGNDDALAAALELLLSDSKSRAEIGRAGRRRAIELGSFEAMARRAVEAYMSKDG